MVDLHRFFTEPPEYFQRFGVLALAPFGDWITQYEFCSFVLGLGRRFPQSLLNGANLGVTAYARMPVRVQSTAALS